MQILAPTGWACAATIGADGSSDLAAYPQGQPEPCLLYTSFAAPVQASPTTPGSSTTLSPQAQALLAQAQAAYTQSQVDLKAGNLGNYQTDINSMESYLQQVQALTGGPVASTTTTTTTNPGQAAIAGLNS